MARLKKRGGYMSREGMMTIAEFEAWFDKHKQDSAQVFTHSKDGKIRTGG